MYDFLKENYESGVGNLLDSKVVVYLLLKNTKNKCFWTTLFFPFLKWIGTGFCRMSDMGLLNRKSVISWIRFMAHWMALSVIRAMRVMVQTIGYNWTHVSRFYSKVVAPVLGNKRGQNPSKVINIDHFIRKYPCVLFVCLSVGVLICLFVCLCVCFLLFLIISEIWKGI